ncbi:MAG: hypothetical protein ACJA2R_000223 [Saprospiraceae bacterium]|jgi:uncharacterized protein (TIGR02647 family)|tara:strand:- start:1369 stop:1617 length:249 start_codon:yes stop_codon:yes gene_type:complete
MEINKMNFNERMEEIKLLNQFNLKSKTYGIKIHERDASVETVSAAVRLFNKGLTDHRDGGYLTALGVEAASHAQALCILLED